MSSIPPSAVAAWLLYAFPVLLLIVLFVVARQGRSKTIPSISISLGITFTFIGIFVALLGFNVDDIQGSIPELLDGMRLAFGTSIMGMVAAVTYRVSPQVFRWMEPKSRSRRRRPEVATVEDLDAAQARRHRATGKQLEQIHRALAGNGDATLITQLQKLRTSFVDKQDEMLQAFNTFAEKVAEDQTEALIEALSEVIRDFNAKINEQFGENFKQLNEAVGRLLDWQKQHAEHVEQMTQQLRQSLQGIQDSEQALQEITGHASRFTTITEKVEAVMTAYHHEIEALEQHLADFAELGQTAKEAFPEIEKNIEGITATYKEHVERATTGMQEAAGTHRDAIGRLLESMQTNQQELNRTLADGVSNTAERVEDTTKTFAERIEHSTDQLEESVKAQQRAITEMLETLQTHQKDTNQTVEQMVEQTSDNVANQIETLDEELGKELEKALKALGNQLASLSDKFVDDYGPLTDKLQRLVESSKRINGGHSS